MNNLPSLESPFLPSICDFKGSVSFIHTEKSVRSRAYSFDEPIEIEVALPSDVCPDDLSLYLYKDGDDGFFSRLSGDWRDYIYGKDVFVFAIPPYEIDVGLYFFSPVAMVDGVRFAGSMCGDDLVFSSGNHSVNRIQLSVFKSEFKKPEELLGGTIYHIFVDRYNRGSKKVPVKEGAVVKAGNWDCIPEYPDYPGAPMKNNIFYGGTIWGITEKLDYIKSLGIKAIYLSPIFESPSNHKYDTSDYLSVDSMFGSDEALVELINEAGKRGIRIILDGVFNHTGDDSIYFNRYLKYGNGGAYNSTSSRYYSWYEFKNYPEDYTCWWGIRILPRISTEIESCRNFFVGSGGVIEKYRDLGIYGIRLDVADELSDSFIGDVKSVLSKNGESILYGEVWEDASNKIAYNRRKSYYNGRELDGVMNYPLRKGLLEFITLKSKSSLEYAINSVLLNAPDYIMHSEMNILGTHDTERILTILSGVSAAGCSNAELCLKRMSDQERKSAISRLICLYTVMATLPGIPTVYYGDEAGLEGYNDPFNRMPYPWGKENAELVSYFKHIGSIRLMHPAYKNGSFNLISLTDELLIFTRNDSENIYLTAMNNSESAICLEFAYEVSELVSNYASTVHTLDSERSGIYALRHGTEFQIKKI